MNMSNNPDQPELLIPTCSEICRIQLFRTSLVRVLHLDERIIHEFCSGCFVRVLLELNESDVVDSTLNHQPTTNDYHCAMIRGVRRLEQYEGFTWDNTKTDLHFDIELPPTIRPFGQPNYVQLNSISNSPIQNHEYTQWVNQMRQSDTRICTPSQVELRLSVLTQHLKKYLVHEFQSKRHRGKSVFSEKVNHQWMNEKRENMLENFKQKHKTFTKPTEISSLSKEELCTLEAELQRELEGLRSAISEKEKCLICKECKHGAIFYPCRHLVVCTKCAQHVTYCPVEQCGAQVLDIIEPFVG